jgi:DNA-binding transcriptional LysR family regulator
MRVEIPQGGELPPARMRRADAAECCLPEIVQDRFQAEHVDRSFGRPDKDGENSSINEALAIYAKHEKIFVVKQFNLDQLATFAKVVECGSFSGAAEKLGLTQPAVSLQIRQLEKRLGTALIERIGRKVRPTAAGDELFGHVDRIDAAVGSAVESVARHASEIIGHVRMGTDNTVTIFLLPPVLGALRKRYPSLEISVSTGNAADMVKAVEENRIDLAFATLPVSSRALEVTPVLDDAIVAIARHDMVLPHRLTAANLAKLPLLLSQPGSAGRRITDRWFARGDATVNPAMSLGSAEAIKAMAIAGLGCGIVPEMAIGKDSRESFIVRPLSPPLKRTLGLVIRKDKRLSKGLKAIYDALLGLRRR